MVSADEVWQGHHARTIEDAPVPRWDRERPIYPTYLRCYLDCPRRFRLQYLDRIPVEKTWQRPLEIGDALHKAMEFVADAIRRGQRLPDAHVLRTVVERILPEAEYDDPRQRDDDIAQVMGWIDRGTRYITHGNPDILRLEEASQRKWNDPSSGGPMAFGAKADLLLRRRSRRGSYLEIIDYKTGYSRDHTWYPPILTRIALKSRIDAAMQSHTEREVRFTYLWFNRDKKESIVFTRERMNDDWRELHQVMTRLLEETSWPMQPSDRVCVYCPYHQTYCHPGATSR